MLIRRIRDLLYEQGFTISGARHRLEDASEVEVNTNVLQTTTLESNNLSNQVGSTGFDFASAKAELFEILNLLRATPKLAT